jgi:hypothetical protein
MDYSWPLNESEIAALRAGMSRLGYKVKFCPMSGFIQLFNKDNVNKDGDVDQTKPQYLFIRLEDMAEIRKKKLFRMGVIHTSENGHTRIRFHDYYGSIGYYSNREYNVYTLKGEAKMYCCYYHTGTNPLFILNGHMMRDASNVWQFQDGSVFQIMHDKIIKINGTDRFVKTNLKINKGSICKIKMSTNPVNIITLTIEQGIYFIRKHELNSYTKHELYLDGGEYWFVYPEIYTGKYRGLNLYSTSTGEVADNIIFEHYTKINKEPGEVYVAKGIAYPTSAKYTYIYSIDIEYGEKIYFGVENDNIVYIPPQSNGKLTKPAVR